MSTWLIGAAVLCIGMAAAILAAWFETERRQR